MSRRTLIDNPVLRHTGRLASPGRVALWSGLVLALVAGCAALLQQYWVQLSIYSGQPRLYARWYYLVVLAEVIIVLPWAAVQGAVTWRRLASDGHLDEYRRTCLSTAAVISGALYGSIK